MEYNLLRSQDVSACIEYLQSEGVGKRVTIASTLDQTAGHCFLWSKTKKTVVGSKMEHTFLGDEYISEDSRVKSF